MKNIIFISFILVSTIACSENRNKENIGTKDTNELEFYVANWNIENLFDTVDDVDKFDEWFTPSSEVNWTEDKLEQKLNNLAKVISGMNNGNGPDILGIEEVEHEALLELLIEKIKVDKNYKIVHEESPDARGIDNAIIYNSDLFNLLNSDAIEVSLGNNKTTRDIIYAELGIGDESVHVFVNHWPSRREGLKKSEPRRITAAQALRSAIEKVSDFEKSNIIILGDLNDLPSNNSVSKILNAQKFDCEGKLEDSFGLFNLTYSKFQKGEGTYKYKNHWNMLDQVIISNSLLDKEEIDYICGSFEILKPEFLIQKVGKYKGTSLPTYGGRKYLGGYSDHFAIGALFSIVK